jgi:hypothetical protein
VYCSTSVETTRRDLLRESASQGSIQRAALEYQGEISAEGYKEQAASYNLMATAARNAASAENTSTIGSFFGGALQGVGALVSLATPQQCRQQQQ